VIERVAPRPWGRVEPARVLFATLSIVAAVTLLWLGRGMTFFADEWAFIESRSLGDIQSWFVPHNEHWSTFPVLLYRGLVETVGIGSYVPYHGALVALHVVVAILVYRLTSRSAGRRFALVAGAIVLFLGGGFENLYWVFQIGFVGSTLLGLLAMEVTDARPSPKRAWIVAGLLLASLATSGIGVVMSFAVGIEWLVDRRWRRFVPYLVVPAAIFLIWYLAFGRYGQDPARDPLSAAALASIPRFVADGVGSVLGVVAGVPYGAGLLVLIAVAIAVGLRHRRRLRSPRVVGIALAVVSQYALAALIRAHLFEGQAEYTRYLYTPVVLAIVAAAVLVRGIKHTSPGRKRLFTTIGLAVWATTALVLNGRLLLAGRELFLDRADMTRALVTVALEPDPPPGIDLSRSLVLVPSPESLRRIVDRYGDPRTDSLVPGSVRPIPPKILAEARRRLIEGAPVPTPRLTSP
jgi:hypothetical protein